jgi:hypothetical protein
VDVTTGIVTFTTAPATAVAITAEFEFDVPVWDRLFPVEQARIIQLVVERVTVRADGLEIGLRVEGIASVVEDLRRREPERTAA